MRFAVAMLSQTVQGDSTEALGLSPSMAMERKRGDDSRTP
jgi:hypothetical protein